MFFPLGEWAIEQHWRQNLLEQVCMCSYFIFVFVNWSVPSNFVCRLENSFENYAFIRMLNPASNYLTKFKFSIIPLMKNSKIDFGPKPRLHINYVKFYNWYF